MHACINASTQTHSNRQIRKVNKKISKGRSKMGAKSTTGKQKDKHNALNTFKNVRIKQFREIKK